MAREVGFEPTTCGLEDRCSIQLSYSRICFGGYNAPCYRLLACATEPQLASSEISPDYFLCHHSLDATFLSLDFLTIIDSR